MIVTSVDDNKLTAIDIKTETPAFEIPLRGSRAPWSSIPIRAVCTCKCRTFMGLSS